MVVIVMLCTIVNCLFDLLVPLLGLGLEPMPGSCTKHGSVVCQKVFSKYSR
jgi:hypothetical protein